MAPTSTCSYVNARNHGFDPVAWVRDLDPARTVQLHVVGYSRAGGRLQDFHAESIQAPIMELVGHVLRHAPVQAAIIERDNDLPATAALGAELERLKAAA